MLMTKRLFSLLLVAGLTLGAAAQLKYNKYHAPVKVEKKWRKYNPGEVIFRDKSPESEGSRIYHAIIPDPTPYIRENALRVLQTLYFGPKDKNIPQLERIY